MEQPYLMKVQGHSHILKVINDKKLGLLHMNPGLIYHPKVLLLQKLLRH